MGSEHLIVLKPQLGTKISNYMECAIILRMWRLMRRRMRSWQRKNRSETEVVDFRSIGGSQEKMKDDLI